MEQKKMIITVIVNEYNKFGIYEAMFKRTYSGINGCPLGKGNFPNQAIDNLINRVNLIQGTDYKKEDFEIETNFYNEK